MGKICSEFPCAPQAKQPADHRHLGFVLKLVSLCTFCTISRRRRSSRTPAIAGFPKAISGQLINWSAHVRRTCRPVPPTRQYDRCTIFFSLFVLGSPPWLPLCVFALVCFCDHILVADACKEVDAPSVQEKKKNAQLKNVDTDVLSVSCVASQVACPQPGCSTSTVIQSSATVQRYL